jgi:MFS family permease
VGLVAVIAPPELRGAAFGLRQSLDTAGAFIGPLLAIGLMWLFADDFASVFWVAVIPAFAALALILFLVHEPERPSGLRRVRNPLSRRELAGLGAIYWWMVAVAAIFTLARFSEAFLILRAEGMGLSLMFVPLVLVVLNIAYALSAYPVGALSDGMNRIAILIVGLMLLIAADLVLAFAPGLWGILAGVVLWGLHMGFTQGVLATLVADTAPAELRGTAFGMFNLVTGAALLAASVIAGGLWDAFGAQWTFLVGAAFALLTIGGLIPLHGRLARRAQAADAGKPIAR